MKGLLDQLIGYVWAVKVAGIDVVHARCNGIAQNSDCTWNIAREPPDSFLAIPSGKLHCAITHAIQGYGSVRKGKRVVWAV
jgi:hypothetical protein